MNKSPSFPSPKTVRFLLPAALHTRRTEAAIPWSAWKDQNLETSNPRGGLPGWSANSTDPWVETTVNYKGVPWRERATWRKRETGRERESERPPLPAKITPYTWRC
jgi:hypothetical protein